MAAEALVNYLSVCSGIEAVTLAWHPLGFQPLAFSEIDPFACALLSHYFPNVPNWGDMTKFEEWPDAEVDVLAGGTPCQSFSVAGKRGGLDDHRGNLTELFFRGVAVRYRPRWIVWENVPGVLSIDKGRTFGALLGWLGEHGYGFAYRVLDARWFGVPQRRRRVFVVGHLGDWRRAAAVLLERESLFRDPAPSEAAREGTAGTPGGLPEKSGWSNDTDRMTFMVDTTQITSEKNYSRPRPGDPCHPLTASQHPPLLIADPISANEGKTYSHEGKNNFRLHNVVTHSITTQCGHATEDGMGRGAPIIAHTLRGEGFDASEDGTGRGAPIIAFSCKDSGNDSGPLSPTLRSMNELDSNANAGGQVAVAFDAFNQKTDSVASTLRAGQGVSGGHVPAVLSPVAVAFAQNQRQEVRELQVAGALSSIRRGDAKNETLLSTSSFLVRRLTPRECERLQGIPENWTLIPYRGKPAADGPRYRAIGNSMAVPVVRWIGERLKFVDGLP